MNNTPKSNPEIEEESVSFITSSDQEIYDYHSGKNNLDYIL